MPFADILGHAKQLEGLSRSLQNGRLHHAYLFIGPEGVGKRTVAQALAKSVHCKAIRCDFCDQCAACLSIRDRNHPDVQLIEPQPGKKEINIGQIRELSAKISLRSFSGLRKIALIDPAELMNYHAQNALLKTLEEPPVQSTLILITKSTGALLPTLLSRCLRVSFGFLPVREVAEYLTRHTSLESVQGHLLAALAMGSLGQALAWNTPDIQQERKEWIERYSALLEKGHRGALELAESLAGDKEKCLRVLQWIEGWNRDVLALQISGADSLLRNVDLVENLQKAASSLSKEHVLGVLSELSSVGEALQKNYNRRMVLENFFLNVSAPGRLPA